jgi:ribose transport system substrate-binding protein
MKSLLWKTGVIVSGLVFVLASTVFAEENKVNLGVSIPAATHGWTGGVVFWANQAKKDLEKAHPGLKITVKTAGSPAEQANQLQDLLTATKIDTLVVLPFESASLTPWRS